MFKRYIISILIILSCIPLSAQFPSFYDDVFTESKTPKSVNIRIGDSELTGLASIELQYSRLSISGGWRPYKIIQINKSTEIFELEQIHSYGFGLTMYGKPWNRSSCYLTMGGTNKGYGIKDPFTNNQTVGPSFVTMIGYKSVLGEICPGETNRLSMNSAVGFKTNGIKMMVTFEVLINFALIKQ